VVKKSGFYDYDVDLEEQFLSSAILDLEHGETTYVYKQNILDRLKGIFNELEIRRNDFYWAVRNMEAERQKPKKGRPKKYR
jgi:hypothetical protein